MCKITIAGRKDRYADWLKRVQAEADRVAMSDAVREHVTNPMLKDGWKKCETPEHFVASVLELFSD
jgi:phosphohistidine phosphatase SixA